jgi:hypothetical protein
MPPLTVSSVLVLSHSLSSSSTSLQSSLTCWAASPTTGCPSVAIAAHRSRRVAQTPSRARRCRDAVDAACGVSACDRAHAHKVPVVCRCRRHHHCSKQQQALSHCRQHRSQSQQRRRASVMATQRARARRCCAEIVGRACDRDARERSRSQTPRWRRRRARRCRCRRHRVHRDRHLMSQSAVLRSRMCDEIVTARARTRHSRQPTRAVAPVQPGVPVIAPAQRTHQHSRTHGTHTHARARSHRSVCNDIIEALHLQCGDSERLQLNRRLRATLCVHMQRHQHVYVINALTRLCSHLNRRAVAHNSM